MRIDCSNDPSAVRRAGVRALWGLAVLAAVPAAGGVAMIVTYTLRSNRLPRFHPEEVGGLLIVTVPPVLFALAAEGLRRATGWAVGLATTVTIGAGVLLVLPALLLLANLSQYDDVRRKQVAAIIGLTSVAAAMFKLAAGVARCGPHLEEVRGRRVRAFEPVMATQRPAGEAGGESEGQ